MENYSHPIHLNDDDVIAFQDKLFKAETFNEAFEKAVDYDLAENLHNKLASHGISIPHTSIHPNTKATPMKISYKKWFDEGVEIQILKTDAKGWRKGKVKIKCTIEFYSDESDSPLDDIRQEINKNE